MLKKTRRIRHLIPAALAACLLVPSTAPAAMKDRISDQEITDAVEDELFFDQAVDSHALDVTTKAGVVTLEGEVENVLAQKRAERIAETVHGVLLVDNEVEVKPYFEPSDQALAADVRSALLADPATDSYELEVSVDDRMVTLTGTVDSLKEQELSLTVARGVDGVKSVIDGIVVAPKTRRSDLELMPEIEKALEWNTLVDDGLVDVAVENGNVKLSGTVGSAAELREASRTASVAGVKAVDTSGLDIEPWARDRMTGPSAMMPKSDSAIETAIRHELMADPRVSSFNVDTKVKDGKVTLRGTVDNLIAKRAAADSVRNVAGVERIENRIKVNADTTLTDSRIENTLDGKLNRNVYLDEESVEAEVTNNLATLTGTVGNWFEKAEAERLAGATAGVEAVDNDILVLSETEILAYDPWVDGAYYYEYSWYDYEPTLTFHTDAEILEDVREELFWSPFVDSDAVTAIVDDGTVTLTGTVDSWSESQSAVENAYEGGAAWVVNDLEIDPTGSSASQ